MASYTMTIAEMMNNPLTRNLFPTDYPFYTDDEQARKLFEDKFIKHYYYREIGFETPFMFIQKLESHLILNMPYWIQLYQTELESRNINFMLNKDLRETFIREVDTENETSGTNSTQQNSSNNSSITQEGTSTNTHKESHLNDGVSQPSLGDGYLTGTSSDNGSSTTSGTSNSTDSLTSKGMLSQSENGKTIEKTDLLSQGNIGVVSSARLLKEWRAVLINMDQIIIDSCNDLFMKLY